MKQISTPPKAFHLAVNYRSHAGIVNCAHTVVKLISSFWPYSIDALSRERGKVNGARPIFFTDVVQGFVGEVIFLSVVEIQIMIDKLYPSFYQEETGFS